jgi:hypothetical protein
MVEWGAVDMLSVPSRQSSSIPFLAFMDGSRHGQPVRYVLRVQGRGNRSRNRCLTRYATPFRHGLPAPRGTGSLRR